MVSNSEVIEEYEAFITATYIAYAILIVYEYVITLRHEVGMMWQMKHTGATWLFILNRYLMLVNITVQCLPVYSQRYGSYYYVYITRLPLLHTYRGCGVTLRLVEAITMAQYLVFALVLATRFCMIIADIIVLALTWMKTYRNSREFLRMNMGVSLSILLLRDGTIYFVVLLVMNIAQICVENVPRLQVLSPVITFVNNLTPILTSRFLINLRQVDQLKDESDGAGFSRFTVPGFRAPTSITGNIGECLEFDGWETPEQTTEESDSVALHLELTSLSTPLDVQIAQLGDLRAVAQSTG
ncbi:hypothetical protein EW026_g2018 [Hermanssonia centrifuga]|uniref:DUF6533 domain-containing protein n=1 Tax=Hermanssonia centrifuga TaxID=98765 RepID=A0A4S4KQK3_9APHY|nr:hypothetical protein EW026_g2018 [Hermanssonia centrifuga]